MIKILILFSLINSTVFAEITRETKEQIGRDLNSNEEFKRAYTHYLEEQDALYEPHYYEDKERFKEQYLKYIKSKNCMQFLVTEETLEKIVPIASKLDSIQKKNSAYSKVQLLLDEASQWNDTYTKSAMVDGYKFCSFKVAESTIQKTKNSLNDNSIVRSNLKFEEKLSLITKNNGPLNKAMTLMFKDVKDYFTNSKITKEQRSTLKKKIPDHLYCAFYFTPEDKVLPVVALSGEYESELRILPEFLKDVEQVKMEQTPDAATKLLEGDYSKCTFQVSPDEISKNNLRKTNEKAETDQNYALLQKMLSKAHPKIKEMVAEYEKSFYKNSNNNDYAKKMLVKTFPNYLEQVNQAVSFNLYGMLQDPVCKKAVSAKALKCVEDEKYQIVNSHVDLLLLFCVEEYKPELRKVCKYEEGPPKK